MDSSGSISYGAESLAEGDLAESGRPPSRRPLLQLLRYVGPHRKYAALTVAFGTAGFLLSFVYPWVIGAVVDLITGANASVPLAQRTGRLLQLAELAAVTAVLQAAVVYGRGHYNTKLGDAIAADLRRDLFEHLQRLSVRFYAKQRTGTILSRVVNDVQEATSIIYMGIVVAGMDATQLLLAFVFLASISPKLTLACAVVFPLYGILFRVMNPRVRGASEAVQRQLARLSGDMAERVAGQALVKTYTAEARESESFGRAVSHHHQLVVRESHLGYMVSAWGELLVHLGTTIVIGYGGWLALTGELTAGMLTRFLGYIVILYGPVRRFAELNITYQSSLSAIRRIFQILGISPGVRERAQPVQSAPSAGHVALQDVRFRYSDGTDESRVHLESGEVEGAAPGSEAQWVLDGVSFEVSPGERIAVVGASGAGKSTLLSLVPRLYDATHGKVLIDGVDVRDYALRALRSAIGIVQQDSFIFTGSVRHNIAYGRPDATDEEIVAAARAAHAHEFIVKLPNGYDSLLGERGVNLSGGQRQRISIARALLRDPRILILDEATSSLDTESERIVQEALERLMHGRTCFIIAHRLSTIRNADRILVLDQGQIIESGAHADLLEAGGAYARFIRAQATLV